MNGVGGDRKYSALWKVMVADRHVSRRDAWETEGGG